MSWVVSPAISKASKGRARLSQFITPCLPLTPRPPRFTFRDPRADIGPTQASQDNLPSLRSADWQPEFSSAVLHPNTLTGRGQFGGHSCRSHQRHIDARRSHRGHCPLANLLSHSLLFFDFPRAFSPLSYSLTLGSPTHRPPTGNSLSPVRNGPHGRRRAAGQ